MTDEDVEQLITETTDSARQIARRYFPAHATLVEEAMQDYALDLWKVRKTLTWTRSPHQFAINRMHYICLRIKQQHFTRQPLLEELDFALEERTVGPGESGHLRDLEVRLAFDKLPTHLWVVAWLVYGEGFLVSETARRLGLPRLLAEERLSEATARLQALLKDWR